MSETIVLANARHEPKSEASNSTCRTNATSLGAVVGLVGGTFGLAKEADDLFHHHQIDILNNRLSTLNDTAASMRQSEQTLQLAGQANTAAYRALEARISVDQTKATAIHRTIPPDGGEQITEGFMIGMPTLVGSIVLGAVIGNYLGKKLDRRRGRSRQSNNAVRTEQLALF